MATLRNDSIDAPLLATASQSERCLAFLHRHFQHPTMKTYLFVTIVFGIITGLLAAFYDACFQLALQLIWGIRGESPHGWFETWLMDLPSVSTSLASPLLTRLADAFDTSLDRVAFLYILTATTVFATLAGVVQRFMGFPGDLPNTVGHVHKMEAVPIRQLPSMFLCSICTIVSGGSLGPEAPLLAMCASTTGWISERVLGHSGQMLRDCTLIGMASGLAAFFGVGLGGALFAFEVLHRTGLQFFEAITFGVSSGLITLLVFRGTLGLKFGSIWEFEGEINEIEFLHFVAAILVGIVLAFIAILFTKMHGLINKALLAIGLQVNLLPQLCSFVLLQEHHTPIKSGLLGGFLIGVIGILLPPTLFWSEFEISNMGDPSHELTHIWPQGGVWGTGKFSGGDYECWIYFLIGFFKLIAISITVLSGLRGGFIFPLMFAGAAFGHGILTIPKLPILSGQPVVLMTMAGAAALNASITRTPFASSLILTALSGHLEILPPILTSALVAFFITMPFEFIKTQQYRTDILSVNAVIGQSVVVHDGRRYRPVFENGDGKHQHHHSTSSASLEIKTEISFAP